MESSAIAVLASPATTQNGVLSAEPQTMQGDGTPSLFGRMLGSVTDASGQSSAPASADAVLKLLIPTPVQLTADTTGQRAAAATVVKNPELLSNGGVLSTLLALQSTPISTSEKVEIPRTPVESVGNEVMKVPVTRGEGEGEGLAVGRENPANPSDIRDAAETPTGVTELLLASVVQMMTPQPASVQQQQAIRPDAADAKVQPVAETVPLVGVSVVTRVQVQPDVLQQAETSAQPVMGNQVAELRPDMPQKAALAGQLPAGKAEPASPIPAPAAAAMANASGRAVFLRTAEADGDTPAVDGEGQPVQARRVAPGHLKGADRSGHEPAAVRKGETAPLAADGRLFDRPLLEVKVEGAETEQSTELAGTPAKVDAAADATVGARPSHPLIGGNVVAKAEPSAPVTGAEAGRAPSHEQILSQVKEQIAKADFRADDGRVVLRLHPEELGSLKIDVRLDDQKLRLHIVAENPTVREALVANLDSLRESLSKQQIVMERFDVATGQGQDQQQLYREHRQQVQDGQVHRPARNTTEYAEDGETVNRQTKTAYWAPQDGSLLNVRF